MGYIAGILIQGVLVALTLWAPRRPRLLANLAYRVAAAYNEVPSLFVILIVVSSIPPIASGRVVSAVDWVAFGAAGLVVIGLVVISWRGWGDGSAVLEALNDGLGHRRWSGDVAAGGRVGRGGWTRLTQILLMPFVFRPLTVKATRNVAYGPAGRRNRLDIYSHRSRPEGAPVLIQFHGGGFYGGRKSVESRALLFRLASRGWVTISANYRLRPRANFFDHLFDAKRAIAWVHENALEFGADPSTLVVSGGSAGGTLASIAGLTQNEARYQPGFELADTSVMAVASLYGWYGGYYEMGSAHSEVGVLGHPTVGAPPFFIAHGAEDSLAHIETARRFVDHLDFGSPNPVVFAELPHGQHAFDLFHSFRFSAVVDGIEKFAGSVRESRVSR